jgi:hypothetical protein
MREACVDAFRARFFQCFRDLRDRPAGVAHVVDYQAVTALHVADDVHDFGLVRLVAALIAQSQFRIQPLRVSAGSFRPARIRRDDGQIRHRILLVVPNHHRRCVQVIHRNIKEPLNLRGVQIHRHNSIGAGGAN